MKVVSKSMNTCQVSFHVPVECTLLMSKTSTFKHYVAKYNNLSRNLTHHIIILADDGDQYDCSQHSMHGMALVAITTSTKKKEDCPVKKKKKKKKKKEADSKAM